MCGGVCPEAVDTDGGFFTGRLSAYLGVRGDIASRRQLLVVIQKTVLAGTAGPEKKGRDCFWHHHLGLGAAWAANCGDLIGAQTTNPRVDGHVHTAIFKMGDQQGPSVWHRGLCSTLYGSLDGRGVWGRMDTYIYVCVCLAESIHCSPKTITTLLTSCTPTENKKFKILPYDPAIPLLGIHTEETRIERDMCTPVFIEALFIIARTWKRPRCPSADEWIRKLWYLYTMEYYSAIKKNRFESVLMRWMKLKPITQSEVDRHTKDRQSRFDA